ncbi:MAG TPA: sulfotransferase [Gammaproteobacteria bacterium]|nr:sulfotransferase [Gammaproteobacteria bacterium]
MQPDVAAVLMPRAVAAHQQGDLTAAEREYRAVLAAAPGHADATHFLGLLLHQRGESEQGLGLMQQALSLSPQNYQYRSNLAGVLNQLGRPRDAERLYREALALKPDHRDSHVNLGMLYAAEGDHPRALACFDVALRLAPGDYTAWFCRAQSLQQLARGREALAAYREAAAAAADDPERLQHLGVALREAGEFEEAERCHARALKLAPDSPQAVSGLGNVLAMGGDLSAAERHYRRAIALKPDYAGAFHNLVDVARLAPGDLLWPALMALAERATELPPESAIPLHFTLGRVWEGQQDYPRAFRHFREGNRLKRAGIQYDEAAQARFFADFIDAYPAMVHHGLENGEQRPVFIVGMPRSGTTLAEQILASHPAVHGAGETHALRNCLREELPPDAGDYGLPRQVAGLDTAALQRAAARYGRHLDEIAPGALRVTNKLPGNMVFLGLMRLLFPRARIIHCRRDPLDTCLSCYTKLFTTGHPFSYELGELGRFHRMYRELMAGWRRLLPSGSMLELDYEALVADFEGGARRLVDYCGLPWDEACLSFHTAARPVRTASLAQVRQPIYSSSVGRWKKYESELAPLKEALAGS